MRVILRFLRSGELAIICLTILLVICILGPMIPQEGKIVTSQLEQWQKQRPALSKFLAWAGFFDIFKSKFFFAVLAVFWINLLLCTAHNLYYKVRFLHFLSEQGSKSWGAIIVHIALLLSIATIFVNKGFGTEGKFVVREGMRFQGGKLFLSYHYGSLQSTAAHAPYFNFTMIFDKFMIDYQGETTTKRSAKIEIEDSLGYIKHKTIAVNNPLTYNGYTFTMSDFGYAPRLTIYDRQTNSLSKKSTLIIHPLNKNYQGLKNIFQLAENALLEIDFFPNAVKIDEKNFSVVNDGYHLKNPVILFTLHQNGKVIGKQFWQSGQKQPFRFGRYEIGVEDVKYWIAFLVARSPGLYLVYFSMWLGLAGFILCYYRVIFEQKKEETDEKKETEGPI